MIQDVGRAPKATPQQQMKQLQELAHSFEGIFFQMLQKSMRSTIKSSGLMGGGQAEAVFTQLFDAEVAERGAQRGKGTGLGIAESILKKYGQRIMKGAAPENSIRDWKA
jgi:Rod binding domain-containing protein